MSESYPRASNAILSDRNQPDPNTTILGRLDNLDRLLKSESIAQRIKGLNDTLGHGNRVIDLMVVS